MALVFLGAGAILAGRAYGYSPGDTQIFPKGVGRRTLEDDLGLCVLPVAVIIKNTSLSLLTIAKARHIHVLCTAVLGFS